MPCRWPAQNRRNKGKKMIEQLKKQNTWGECLEKIDEIIGVVNALEEQISSIDAQVKTLVNTSIVDGGRLQAIKDMVNVHEKEIDKLQMKVESEKCDYENEKDWIGKLCKFRDCEECGWQYGILTDIVVGNDYPYWMGNIEFAECQPVSEEEFKDVIYKRG